MKTSYLFKVAIGLAFASRLSRPCLGGSFDKQKCKAGIHLRQRQAEARCDSLCSASIDGAPSRATCLRGCCDPSHRMLVDQSEASPRNSPPYAQYGWNMPHLTETEKHSSVHGAACRGCRTVPRLASASNVFPA